MTLEKPLKRFHPPILLPITGLKPGVNEKVNA
jgi:hypothetical protein